MVDITGLTRPAKIFWLRQRVNELERAIKREDTNERKIELIELMQQLEDLEGTK